MYGKGDRGRKKSVVSSGTPELAKEAPTPVVLASPEETFGYYLEESIHCRRKYGLGKSKDGKFFIEDLGLIEKLGPALKQMLREWVLEKKKKNQWK